MIYMSLLINPSDGDLPELNHLVGEGWHVLTISSSGATIWILLGKET